MLSEYWFNNNHQNLVSQIVMENTVNEICLILDLTGLCIVEMKISKLKHIWWQGNKHRYLLNSLLSSSTKITNNKYTISILQRLIDFSESGCMYYYIYNVCIRLSYISLWLDFSQYDVASLVPQVVHPIEVWRRLDCPLLPLFKYKQTIMLQKADRIVNLCFRAQKL